jgi:hypothetical protein
MHAPRVGTPRYVLLLAIVAAQTVLVWLLVPLPRLVLDKDSTLAEYARVLVDAEAISPVLIACTIIAAMQAVLLWPVRKPTIGANGRSIWFTAITAALAGTALLAGVIALLADVGYLIDSKILNSVETRTMERALLASGFASWIILTPLMVAFVRRPDPAGLEGRLNRLASRLLMGTVIEAVASIPIALMVRRKTDCYCGQGTFWAMFVHIGLGALLIGPALVLPVLAKRRRAWYAGHCPACGYDMKGLTNAARCPECGSGWKT